MISILSPREFRSRKIPAEPGVYLFKDEREEILYIGKAKNLRQRVGSYVKTDHSPKTQQLLTKIRNIDWIIVTNEVEALLLENKLVKQHMPRYNINLKDAKTFAYIALTRESIPRVLTSRKVSPRLESFGPYTDGFMRQDLQKLVVKVFKLRVCRKMPKRACLNFHMGLCTAPCTGNITQEKYREQVEKARYLLKGNFEGTIVQLRFQMQTASAEKKYERALELRNQIASIELLTQRQVVDRERSFDQDAIAFRRLGDKMLAVQMGVYKGVLRGKKEFTVDFQPNVEQEFLKAYYDSNQIPREILLNIRCWQGAEEKKALEEFFGSKRGASVSLIVPSRGNKLSLVKLAEKNLESNLEEDSALVDLQTALNLPGLPRLIEGFDVSNLGAEHVVSGMTQFKDGKPNKANFRRFRLKTVVGQDDFASMSEVVKRRYKRLIEEKAKMPDLIVVDGGPGQVNATKKTLQSLGLQIPAIGLAKKYEEIYLPDESSPRKYNKNSRMMLLLERIRDATHAFSISYNRKRRQMKIRDQFKPK